MQAPDNGTRLHDFPREARAYPFGEPAQPTAGCEPAGFLESAMTCSNPHCARGVEPVIVNTESRVALFVRALVNPNRPPRIGVIHGW